MNEFTVERANVDDIEALLDIGTECGLSPWTYGGYESEMARTDSVILVARDGDRKVVGFIAGRIDVAAEAEIYNIATRLEIRKKRVGSSLLRAFLVYCEQANSLAVWLEVRRSNVKAISFYRNHGFVGAGTRKSFYSAPIEDAEIMSLRLKSEAR